MKVKQPRIAEIQYLRVLQHAIGHYAYLPEAGIEDGAMLGIWLIAAKFAVPVFIFITGLVLFYNYNRELHYGSFILKRCKDILLPYLLWSTVYALIFREVGLPFWLELKQIFNLWLTGTASYHLWYVVMMIQLYLLFPFIQKAVIRINAVWRPWQLALLFVLLIGGYIWLTGQQEWIGGIVKGWQLPLITPLFTEYADRNAIYFYIYFAMGAAAGMNMPVWKARMLKYKALWIILYLLSAGVLYYRIIGHFYAKGSLLIRYDDTLLVQPFMAVFLMLSIPAMSLAAIVFHERTPLSVRRLVNWIGHYSYGAYLAHAGMLAAAVYIVDRWFPSGNVSLRTAAAFVLCTIFSVILAQLLSQFQVGRMFTGTPVLIRKKAKSD
jgi:peptidoglycan/LPS O-acetylase OafA/YrhL